MKSSTENKWEGRWHQLRGKIKAEWNEITDDDLDEADGRLELVAGKIQERYGIEQEKARERLEELQDD